MNKLAKDRQASNKNKKKKQTKGRDYTAEEGGFKAKKQGSRNHFDEEDEDICLMKRKNVKLIMDDSEAEAEGDSSSHPVV